MVFFKRRGQPRSLVDFVEYIESSGSQYIDTGFKPNQDTGVRCSLIITSPQTWRWVFCGRSGSNIGSLGLSIPDTTAYVRGEYGNSTFNFTSASTKDKLTVEFSGKTQTVNGQSYTYSPRTFQSTANMVIFARNTNGSVDSFSSVRLYSLEIYDGGTLAREYLPALDSDGVACLYDNVNKEYVYNSGKGAFSAGPKL